MTGLSGRIQVARGARFNLDVEFAAEPGDTTVVLGPNGAGKSTLLATLAGLLPLDAGQLAMGPEPLDDPSRGAFVPPARRGFGVMPQGGVLFEHLTVRDNVRFGPRATGSDHTAATRAAEAWLERLEVAELADLRPGDLSGGQAQRVALARALATRPRALLLDEPFSALDAPSRTALRRTLDELTEEVDGPVVLVTHDPTEALLLADRVHVLQDGRTAQVGTTEEVRLHPRTSYVAELVDANLVAGVATDGLVRTDTHELRIADRRVAGSVLLRIAPQAVALHPEAPHGSPRNVWATTVEHVEPLGDRVRVLVGAPLPLTVEITAAASEALELVRGVAVHAAVKATEITALPQS